MELKAYERIKFANNLRPLLIKDKCECCGETDKLHLHHDKQFAEMLKETLDRLGYEYKLLKEDYTKEQLENITDMLLGIHIKSTYTTLCEDCHNEIHSGGELIHHFLKRQNNYIKTEYQLNTLLNYLNNTIDQKLFKEEIINLQNILLKLSSIIKSSHGSIGINTIKNMLKEHNLNYEINSYKEYSRKSDNYKKTYWMISKLSSEVI